MRGREAAGEEEIKMGVQLSLDKTYVEKTMKEANKRGIERYSGEKKPENWLLWESDEEPEVNIDLDNNLLRLSLSTTLGEIDLTADLTADIQISLLEMFVKRLNKIKALMESLT